MRLLPVVLSAASATSAPSAALQHAEAFAGNRNICGVIRSNHNGTMSEEITLEPEESCIYRVRGDNTHLMEILNLNLKLDCEDGEMWMFTDEEQYGPFCNEKRRRRGAYTDIDPSNMHGQNFKSKEVDMVFRNGQRARFSFGFSFEFELLPGMPMNGGGMCAWKSIKASNSAFYMHKDSTSNPELAMNLWNTLTESMYNFQCYFDKYRGQCSGGKPVEVSCAMLNWDGECKSMIGKIGAIIAAQCAECTGNGICAEWYGYLSQLQGLAMNGGEAVSYGSYKAPIPYCDEKQCETGTHECDVYATCNEECESYTCSCTEGYQGDGKTCSLICDEDECAADVNPCGEYSVCTNECEGYECTCVAGYEMIDGKCTITCTEGYTVYTDNTCYKTCEAGYENIDNECVIICDDGYIVSGDNTCYKVCPYGYSNIDNVCVIICQDGFMVADDNTCFKICELPYVNFDNVCKLVCDEGYHVEGDECIKDCDRNQCLDMLACSANAICTNECYGYTCTCIEGYQMVDDVCEQICDVDPCANGGNMACGDFSTCTDQCISYECGCIAGYSMVQGKCQKDCDVDPCATNNCGANTRCERECEGYTCKCLIDYIPILSMRRDAYLKSVGRRDAYLKSAMDSVDTSPVDTSPVDTSSVDTSPVVPPGLICEHKNPCHEVKCTKFATCDSGKCKCNNGYAWKNDKCVEKINECITGAHNCAKYATCHDALWGFSCTCNDGYKDMSGGAGTECTHPYYTETGACYLTEYSTFTDTKFEAVSFATSYDHMSAIHYWKMITAQLTSLGHTAENARTVQCAKDAGVLGCNLIDYTKDQTACDWAHTLETVIAEVQKKCNADWDAMYLPFLTKLRLATCVEPNDCLSGIHNCAATATCEAKKAKYGNKTSGFKCVCNAGFYGNGKQCYEEVDECTLGMHKCAPNANCLDISAGYKCQCHLGYVGNGYICSVAIDECVLGTHDCHEYADCTDLPNGYTCKCRAKEGYVGNGKQCTGPADECTDGTHTCHDTTDCVNTYAGFSCKCKQGYMGDPKKGCWPPLTCPWHAEYSADSFAGYNGDFDNGFCSLKYIKVCTKSLYDTLYDQGLKVCKKNDAFAHFNLFTNELFAMGKNYEKKYGVATSHFAEIVRYGAECSVEAGAVPCSLINFHDIVDEHDLFARVKALFDYVFKLCDPIYRAKWEGWLARYHNALICPINECKLETYECHENASCIDRAIGYDCACKKHYYGDGFAKCDEINYCDDNGLCGQYATCKNLHPGYECNCQPGYSFVKGKCLPADPCKTNNGGCDEYATCTSQIVGYEVNHQCKCHKGYYGDGFTCDPVNPCIQHNCDENADCVPYTVVLTEADYNCKCKEGFGGNGFICNVVVDPCVDVTCGAGESKKAGVNTYGMQMCDCVCSAGYHRVGGVCEIKDKCMITKCDEGYKCVNNGDCIPIPTDPCANCHSNASCKMTGYPPAKQCVCNAPSVGDGFVCRGAKACPKACNLPTVCVDGTCKCANSGLWYSWDTKKCVDKNECVLNKQGQSQNNCSPNAVCKNTHGGFTCTCKAGFTGDGVTCNGKSAGGAYDQGSNPYAGHKAPTMAQFAAFDSKSEASIKLYSELATGQCSLMGYEWANMEALLAKMKWSANKITNENYIRTIVKEFQHLGKSAIARSGPQCDLEKAGVVDCTILYLPHYEHRCQSIQRINRIYKDVALNCNTAWKAKFGKMMNYLLQQNQSGKQGSPCDPIEWL